MNSPYRLLLPLLAALAATGIPVVATPVTQLSASRLSGADELRNSFTSPSAEAKPWVYWYWLNGFVTKEGVTADLEAMKRVGIGGALQMDPHLPTPNTVFKAQQMTPLWDEVIQHAMRESDRLGLKMDIANGAGWSGSGGKWIKKNDAMQIVVTSETKVSGPANFSAALPNPPTKDNFLEPIAVLAFPTLPGDDIAFEQHLKLARVGNKEIKADGLFNENPKTAVKIPAGDDSFIEFQLDKALAIQSLVLSFNDVETSATGEVEIAGDGGQFQKVADFRLWHAESPFPNFYTYRTEVNFSPVTATSLRIRFKTPAGSPPVELRKLSVSGGAIIDQFSAKAGYVRPVSYKPVADTETVPAIAKAGVIDLSSKMDETGKLTWNVPKGSWTIVRLASTLTGAQPTTSQLETRGYDVDKFSKEALDHNWNDGLMKKVLELAGPLAGKSFVNVHIDSWEQGTQNWTPKMREEFTKRRGYDPLPFYPVFSGRFVESQAVTERFLWDYRLTMAELISENYFGHTAELCKKNGLKFSVEPYPTGGDYNFDFINSGSHADIPMGEYGAWTDSPSSGESTPCVKMSASISHIYNKPIMQCESFTSGMPNSGFKGHPYLLKSMVDFQFTSGLNRVVHHVYSAQPWTTEQAEPGMVLAQWGTQFGRTVTWWNMSTGWMDYLTRTSSVLQQGTFCADVCVFQGEEDVPPTESLTRSRIRPSLPLGYDFDVCDTPTVSRFEVKDGKLVLPGGMSYRYLVLQQSKAMTPALLRKVGGLVKAGATVIGDKPAFSLGLKDYPASDAEVRKLADEIWGDCDGKKAKEHTYGKGHVICGQTFKEIFSKADLPPDFSFNSNTPRACVNYIHRRKGGDEIYFVANWNRKICETTCSFRVSNMQPEIWHPETGQIEKCPVYKQSGAVTELPIRFEPAGSVFVVFRQPAEPHFTALEEKTTVDSAQNEGPSISIVKAEYGVLDEPATVVDVTKIAQAKLTNNRFQLRASGGALGGDPAPNRVKTLRVEYLQDGRAQTATTTDGGEIDLPETGGTFPPPDAVVQDAPKGAKLLAYKAAHYTLSRENGTKQEVEVPSLPAPIECNDKWEVRFQPRRGAPEKINLEKLISWSEHSDDGVKYFSGTATYSRIVKIAPDWIRKDRALFLDLGQVEVMAQVKFNGKDLGILWKPPFRVDISGLAKAGDNQLEVKVVNLWVNRLIGDEQLPADIKWAPGNYNYLMAIPDWLVNGTPRTSGRFTFTTYQYWKKNDPLVPSGLIGPVKIIPAQLTELKK